MVNNTKPCGIWGAHSGAGEDSVFWDMMLAIIYQSTWHHIPEDLMWCCFDSFKDATEIILLN